MSRAEVSGCKLLSVLVQRVDRASVYWTMVVPVNSGKADQAPAGTAVAARGSNYVAPILGRRSESA